MLTDSYWNLRLTEALWSHKQVAYCSQLCSAWSVQGFYSFKSVLTTFKDQDISEEKRRFLGFPFKTSSGHAVQCSYLVKTSPGGRRAVPCRQQTPASPQPLPVLGGILVCDPCSQAMVLTWGFYQNQLERTLPYHLHPKHIQKTTALNSIQSVGETEEKKKKVLLLFT